MPAPACGRHGRLCIAQARSAAADGRPDRPKPSGTQVSTPRKGFGPARVGLA